MKEIVFITQQKGTQGSYLNLLDLQQYLKDREGYKIKFYCENVKELQKVIKNSGRAYKLGKGEVKLLHKDKDIVALDGIVITDFKTLSIAKEINLWVICKKKLIVMDSIELTYHLKDMKHARFYDDIDLYENLKRFYAEEILFLMPPCNHKIFKKKYPDLNSKAFFKNINVDMVKTIKYKHDPEKYFFRWDSDDEHDFLRQEYSISAACHPPIWGYNKKGAIVPIQYNEAGRLFNNDVFLYRRRKYLEYQEQFGRLIFEYILLGKSVQFVGETHTDDGLTDYLNHFDITFNKDNYITTTKEELEKRMKTYNDRPWL